MGFVQRIFTPPGTGGIEAAQQQAAAAAAKPPPQVPSISAAPPAPPQFQAGAKPGASKQAQITATSMLGAAATAGQQAKKTLLG